MRYGVDAEISREDLTELIAASTVPVLREAPPDFCPAVPST
jgi:hypothetical protein